MEEAPPNMLVVDAAGVKLVPPKGDVTVEDLPNTALELAADANDPEPVPKIVPVATDAALVAEAPNTGGLVAPKVGAELPPNEGTALKPGTDVALPLVIPLPNMLLLVATTGAAVVTDTGAVVAEFPNENVALLFPEVAAAAPNEKLELADDTWPKVVGLVTVAAPPKMLDGCDIVVEMLELPALPNEGCAVAESAFEAAKDDDDAAVVAAIPNEGAVDAVVFVGVAPNPNFGAVEDAPKTGAAVAGLVAPPPKVNELAFVVVDAAVVVVFNVLPLPKVKPPAEVLVAVAGVGPDDDAVMLPNDGLTADAVVVGESGLNALNPEPLPKVGIEDCVVLNVFWGLPEDAFVEIAGRSENPRFGASCLGVGAGEKVIKLEVAVAVFVVVVINGDGVVVKPNPEGVAGVVTAVVLAVGKVYAGGASDFWTLILEAAEVVLNEKVSVVFSVGLVSIEVDAGLVGVWKLKVALLSVDLVGVPKLNSPVDFGGSLGLEITGCGGSILPKPGSLIGSLIKAAIPLCFGTFISGCFLFSSTFGCIVFGASIVSFVTIGIVVAGFGGSSSSS